jgi:hypothetical protein
MEEKNRAQHIADYIQSIAAIEECMQPYRDQRKDLRKNYLENKWLDREDISVAMKAFRLLEEKVDFENLSDVYENLIYTFGGGDPHELGEE